MRKLRQSTEKNVMVLMVDATDHISGKIGLTLTVALSKDGGAFSAITPAIVERGNGWYSLALSTSHTDTLGDLVLHIEGYAADPSDMVLLVEAGAVDADISTVASSVGARVIEGAFTADEVMRLLAAAMVGKRTGIGTATERYDGIDGTPDRIVLTPTDANGNGTPILTP